MFYFKPNIGSSSRGWPDEWCCSRKSKKEFQLKENCRFIAILAAHLAGKCSAEALIHKFASKDKYSTTMKFMSIHYLAQINMLSPVTIGAHWLLLFRTRVLGNALQALRPSLKMHFLHALQLGISLPWNTHLLGEHMYMLRTWGAASK